MSTVTCIVSKLLQVMYCKYCNVYCKLGDCKKKHLNDPLFSHSREKVRSLNKAVVDKYYDVEGQFSISTFCCFQLLNLSAKGVLL